MPTPYDAAADKTQVRIAEALERIASALEEDKYFSEEQARVKLATAIANNESVRRDARYDPSETFKVHETPAFDLHAPAFDLPVLSNTEA